MSPEETETPLNESAASDKRSLSPYAYFIPALVLLVFALGGWVWLGGNAPEPAAVGDVSPTARSLPTDVVDVPGDAFGLVPGPATPWAVSGGPGELPTAVPEMTPAPVPLLGPPAGSFIRVGDAISFYWSAAAELTPDQPYRVYLLGGEERVLLGSAVGPNLGQGYQLRVRIGDFVDEPGDYRWQVVLADVRSGVIIGQSEIRPITLVENN